MTDTIDRDIATAAPPSDPDRIRRVGERVRRDDIRAAGRRLADAHPGGETTDLEHFEAACDERNDERRQQLFVSYKVEMLERRARAHERAANEPTTTTDIPHDSDVDIPETHG